MLEISLKMSSKHWQWLVCLTIARYADVDKRTVVWHSCEGVTGQMCLDKKSGWGNV